jgi:chromosome segregation ATPase
VVETDVARRVLEHAASPEERLEQLMAARSRELEEQARRFDEAMADLERREALLRDMRASVERLLRLGSKDLTEREVELQELSRDFLEREARLSAEEAELNRRRSELGAVELKREAVEQRERALQAREEAVAAAEEQGVAASTHGASVSRHEDAPVHGRVTVLFVPGPAYRLVEVEHSSLTVGASVELDGELYVVSRVGRAPLPGDPRACAYVERVPGSSDSGGSS